MSEPQEEQDLPIGVRMAKESIRRQDEIAARRLAALGEPAEILASPELIERAGGRGSAGWLLAEGDSWFDLPLKRELLEVLKEDHHYRIEHVAGPGHRLEDMAYVQKQSDELAAALYKIVGLGYEPTAILLSGGGNDLTGDPFELLLRHANSGQPGLNQVILKEMIDVQLRKALEVFLDQATDICLRSLERKVPILVHGYARAVPDGRGYTLLMKRWSGPWLEPGFHVKGYQNTPLDELTAMVEEMIDLFNAMVERVANLRRFKGHVHYVDLRPDLPNTGRYKRWWDDELHPSKAGFRRLARRYDRVIKSL